MRKTGSGMHCILLSATPQVTSTFHCREDTVPGIRLFHQNIKKTTCHRFSPLLSFGGHTVKYCASKPWSWRYLKLTSYLWASKRKEKKNWSHTILQWVWVIEGTWFWAQAHGLLSQIQGDRVTQIHFPHLSTNLVKHTKGYIHITFGQMWLVKIRLGKKFSSIWIWCDKTNFYFDIVDLP